ncbi:hypothetical protein NFI96_003302 [Prochilodus magdalenae]|nr:hypothetical protein NFI96_003302 [Prochilodus magdalenae]
MHHITAAIQPQPLDFARSGPDLFCLNTGVPQGCVLSPILYSLFTHDCVPIYGSNTIIKYADVTAVIGLIKDNDETAYRDEEVQKPGSPTSLHQRSNFKFLGTHISSDLTWSLNSSVLVKKAQQHLYFPRSLKKVHLSPRILENVCRCTIESILTNGISVWYGNCCAADRKALQRVVKMAQRITGTQLPTIQDIYHKRCLGRARNIIKDVSHPNPGLFPSSPLAGATGASAPAPADSAPAPADSAPAPADSAPAPADSAPAPADSAPAPADSAPPSSLLTPLPITSTDRILRSRTMFTDCILAPRLYTSRLRSRTSRLRNSFFHEAVCTLAPSNTCFQKSFSLWFNPSNGLFFQWVLVLPRKFDSWSEFNFYWLG